MVVRTIGRGMSVDVPGGQQHITSGAQCKQHEAKQGMEKKSSPFVVHLHRTKIRQGMPRHAMRVQKKKKKKKKESEGKGHCNYVLRTRTIQRAFAGHSRIKVTCLRSLGSFWFTPEILLLKISYVSTNASFYASIPCVAFDSSEDLAF